MVTEETLDECGHFMVWVIRLANIIFYIDYSTSTDVPHQLKLQFALPRACTIFRTRTIVLSKFDAFMEWHKSCLATRYDLVPVTLYAKLLKTHFGIRSACRCLARRHCLPCLCHAVGSEGHETPRARALQKLFTALMHRLFDIRYMFVARYRFRIKRNWNLTKISIQNFTIKSDYK